MSKRNKKNISKTSRLQRNQPKMDLQSLPLEVIVKIMSYVPEPSKYAVLCKKFNQALCYLPSQRHATIDGHNIFLTSEFLNNLDYAFGKVKVECSKLDDFLLKFGNYIQKLVLSPGFLKSHLNPAEVNEILQYTPNVSELFFHNSSRKETVEMLPIEEFKVELPNLKKLNVTVYNIQDVISAGKILNQYNLDSFSCKFETKNEEVISQMINLLLTTKTDIKEVKLTGTDRFFGYYCKLENLTYLNVTCVSENLVCTGIEKLKNLKKLALTFTKEIKKLRILTSPKLPSLEYLEIYCYSAITSDIFDDLSVPVLNMKVLKIRSFCIQDAKHLENIFKAFKQLEELSINHWYTLDAKALNFDQFDWHGCYNSNLKILNIDIPNVCSSNFIDILKVTFPNLTSLSVNRTKYMEPNDLKYCVQQFEQCIEEDEFRETFLKNFLMGSNIDALLATERKFARLSIRMLDTKLTQERVQRILKFIQRQGKNIKEFILAFQCFQTPTCDIPCEVFWQLVAPLTSCRRMYFSIQVVATGNNVDDESAIKSMATGRLEEIKMDLSNFYYSCTAKTMKEFLNLQPNLKKLTMYNESPFDIESKYFGDFLSNNNLECLTWKMMNEMSSYSSGDENDDEDEEPIREKKQTIASIISRQKKLKILKIKFIPWNELFVEIANNCKELEDFEFYGAENLTPESFFAIQNLRNLKTLSFGHDKSDYYEETEYSKDFTKLSSFLIGIRNLNLTTLNLLQLSGVTQENFIQLAALIPSLNTLKIEIVYDFEYHPCMILQHFTYLEELTIDIHVRIDNMHRDYNLNVNPNLKTFINLNLESVLTLNDISNILKANPNLEYLCIGTHEFERENEYEDEYERAENPEEVKVNELDRILKAGEKLKTIYISDLIISDPENIEDCPLKKRFKLFEYNVGKTYFYEITYYELILSSDKAGVEKMMNISSKFLEKAMKQL